MKKRTMLGRLAFICIYVGLFIFSQAVAQDNKSTLWKFSVYDLDTDEAIVNAIVSITYGKGARDNLAGASVSGTTDSNGDSLIRVVDYKQAGTFDITGDGYAGPYMQIEQTKKGYSLVECVKVEKKGYKSLEWCQGGRPNIDCPSKKKYKDKGCIKFQAVGGGYSASSTPQRAWSFYLVKGSFQSGVGEQQTDMAVDINGQWNAYFNGKYGPSHDYKDFSHNFIISLSVDNNQIKGYIPNDNWRGIGSLHGNIYGNDIEWTIEWSAGTVEHFSGKVISKNKIEGSGGGKGGIVSWAGKTILTREIEFYSFEINEQ